LFGKFGLLETTKAMEHRGMKVSVVRRGNSMGDTGAACSVPKHAHWLASALPLVLDSSVLNHRTFFATTHA
jgi:hypothetical protein